MEKITWQKDFEVGIREVDKQHQHLVSLINETVDIIAENREQETLIRIFEALVDYTQYHFSEEKKVFLQPFG
ncbi:hemerythrin domain-containing protein [Colwellia sp. MEBiC06753]